MSETSSLPQRESSSHAPWRFRAAMELNKRMVMKTPEIIGFSYLEQIPPGKSPVIATSHLSDIDVQTVASIAGKSRDIAVASQQTNQKDALLSKLQIVAGRDRFLDIDNTIVDGKIQYFFNPDNYTRMAEASRSGKSVVIAAHEPTYDKKLPNRAGIGAAYLAQLTEDRIVVPATVVIDADEPVGISTQIDKTAKRLLQRKRPTSHVVFSPPIILEKIDSADLMLVAALFKSEQRRQLDKNQKLRALSTLHRLEAQAEVIMRAVAAPLPTHEQSVWGGVQQTNQQTG